MKMKMIFSAAIAAMLLLTNLSVQGQDTIRLSLDSAVSYALSHNKSLLNARYSRQKAHEQTWEATSAGLPQVSAGVDYNNYLGAEASFKMSENAPAATIVFNPSSSLNLNVSQLVYSGSYLVGLQLAKLGEQASELSYRKSGLEVKEQVTRAYFLVLVAERTVRIMEANMKNTQLVYEKTRNLAKAGIIEMTDADKLSVMVTSIGNAKKAAERQVEMAYNTLRLILGTEAKAGIRLTTLLDEVSQQSQFESTLRNAFDVNNNFDFRLVRMQEEISRKQVNLEQASYLPTLAGYYSHTEKLLVPKFDISPKNVIGLKLNIHIFSSGMRKSQVNQSRIGLLMVQNSRSLLSEQLEIQEKQLRFNLNNMLELYANQKKNVEIAKEICDKMTLKYEQGIVSSLEVTSANNNYLSAESDYTNILFQLLDADIALRKLNGNL